MKIPAQIIIAKTVTALPAYFEELSTEKVKERLKTRTGRRELREILRELSLEADCLRRLVRDMTDEELCD